MSQITLLGGLASTVFWPVGYFLSEELGWRDALYCFAGFAISTIPLHIVIPQGRYEAGGALQAEPTHRRVVTGRELISAGALYALITTAVNFLNAGMSTHMISILNGLGVAAGTAVAFATLRGVGQSSARLCEVVFGRSIDPLALNLIASVLMPVSFAIGLYSGASPLAAIVFTFLYGACNGILTITRGTLPLVLFEHAAYGELVGKLVAPSFVFAAMAPVIYAYVIDHFGSASALMMSSGCAGVTMVAGARLFQIYRNPRPAKFRLPTSNDRDR